MGYDAIIFDNDGVLTELTDLDVLHEASREAFRSLGVESPTDEHVAGLVMNVSPDWLAEVCEGYGVDVDSFWHEREMVASRAQQTEIREGRKPLYDDFAAVESLDVPRGIVSSNQHRTVEFILDHFGVGELFGSFYGREPTVESLRRKKPEPYYIERAMADLGAEDALYVGDSDSDVAAAANAGIDSAFVRRPHREGYALDHSPTHELAGLDELASLV